jgi:hypothetical protein
MEAKESLKILIQKGKVKCFIGNFMYELKVDLEDDLDNNRFVFCRVNENWDLSKENIQEIADETNLPVKVSENLIVYPRNKGRKNYLLDYADVLDIARKKESLNDFMHLALPASNEHLEEIKDLVLARVRREKQVDDILISRIISLLEISEINSKTLDFLNTIKTKNANSPKAKEFLLIKLDPFLKNSKIRAEVAEIVKRLITEAYGSMRRGNIFVLGIQRIDDNEIRTWERQEFAKLEARLEVKWVKTGREWHCWNFHSAQDTEPDEAAVCNRCKWYVCNNCGKCAKECTWEG